MRTSVVCQDVQEWAETYTGPKFHALLCDPPYSLQFMNKAWDNDIALHADTWKALTQHLLPGAFGFVFGSSRLYHRLGCALEDAGLRLLPSIFLWLTGSSFPKATRIPDARFDGHRYGGQVLKDAASPILCFQKPYQGKPVDSITATGAGSLWIDGGRIHTMGADRDRHQAEWDRTQSISAMQSSYSGGYQPIDLRSYAEDGRWPANFALCHLPACERVGTRQVTANRWGKDPYVHNEARSHFGYSRDDGFETRQYHDANGQETVVAWKCAPGCAVAALDQQVGPTTSTGGKTSSYAHIHEGWARDAHARYEKKDPGYHDTGMVSRYFFTADWSLDVAEQLAQADPVRYCAKASRTERDKGLEDMPLRRNMDLTGGDRVRENAKAGTNRNGPLSGRNIHPCCKPLALCRWLATLLAPPAAYAPRRLLIPFSGSGSEMCAASLSGHWEEVMGIEQDASYCALAEARLAHWTGWTPPQPELASRLEAGPSPRWYRAQQDLFGSAA